MPAPSARTSPPAPAPSDPSAVVAGDAVVAGGAAAGGGGGEAESRQTSLSWKTKLIGGLGQQRGLSCVVCVCYIAMVIFFLYRGWCSG